MKNKKTKLIKNFKCTNTPGIFKGNDKNYYIYNRITGKYDLLKKG